MDETILLKIIFIETSVNRNNFTKNQTSMICLVEVKEWYLRLTGNSRRDAIQPRVDAAVGVRRLAKRWQYEDDISYTK